MSPVRINAASRAPSVISSPVIRIALTPGAAGRGTSRASQPRTRTIGNRAHSDGQEQASGFSAFNSNKPLAYDRAAAIRQQRVEGEYRHYKPLLVIGTGPRRLDKAGSPDHSALGCAASGRLVKESGTDVADAFVDALTTYRFYDRETDPPESSGTR